MRRILIETTYKNPRECSYGFPWKHDSICYNFKMPDETVMVSDLHSIAGSSDIEVLVVGCSLNDYAFLDGMANLRQLYIYHGENINDLSFLAELTNLRQLYVANSHIKNLDGLVALMNEQARIRESLDVFERIMYGFEGICIESDGNLDGKALLIPKYYVTEIKINGKTV